MRAIRDVEPSVGKSHCEVVMAVLRWCHLTDFHTTYPDIFAGVKSAFEKALEKSWLIMRSPSVAAKVWWESVLPHAGLILDQASWSRCIYNNTRWRDCKSELRVVMRSQVGQRLFANAWREVADDAVSESVELAVEKLLSEEAELTQKVIDRRRQELAKQCEENGTDLYVASKPGSVLIKYRRIEFPVMVTTSVEEYSLRIQAAIKELGLRHGHLQPLFCEDGLCAAGPSSYACMVDKKLLTDSSAARAAITELVDDPAKASGDEIKATLMKHSRMLSSLDKGWKVEMNFFLSQVGETGEARLRSLVLDVLPSKDKQCTLEEAHGKLRAVASGQLCQFVRVGLQRQVENVVGWISVMMKGRSPRLPDTKHNPFLAEVVARLACFFRRRLTTSAGSGDASDLVGREAILDLYKCIQKDVAAKKQQDLVSLRPFGIYQWLLTADEMKVTKQWLSDVLGEGSSKPSHDEFADREKDKEKQKKKDKKKQSDADQARLGAEACFR